MINSSDNNYKAITYISFLIWPIGALMLALKRFRRPWVKNIVWAFIAFYGFHFVPPSEGADIWSSIRIFQDFVYHDYSITEIFSIQYAEGSSKLDVIFSFLSYGVSRITDNPKVLLFCFGILFGYFYSRNLWFFVSRLKGKFQLLSVVGLCLLLVTRPIWGINAFRFHFGVQLFLFGTFNLLSNNNKKGIIFLILAPFSHIGIALPMVLTFIYRIVKNIPVKILFIGYFITLFFAELDLNVLRNFIDSYTPDLLRRSLTIYTSDSIIENKEGRVLTYTITYMISTYMRLFIITFIPIVLYLNRKLLYKDNLFNVFCFFLFFGSVANLLYFSSFQRYSSMAEYIMYGIFFVFIQNNRDFKLKNLFKISIPVMLYYAVYMFRILGMYSFDIHHFINNPILSFFIYEPINLK